MHSSLKTLLEKTQEKISKHKIDRTSISGIILCYSSDENLMDHIINRIRILQKFVSEIVLVLPKCENIDFSEIKKENFHIKSLELDLNILDNEVLAFEMATKQCINDKIIVVPSTIAFESNHIKMLVEYGYPLTTYIGQKGNISSRLFFYDKWINRFIIQLLRLNGRRNLIELFRIADNIAFLRVAQNDEILSFQKKSNLQHLKMKQIDKRIISPILYQRPIDVLEVVKMVAMLNVLREDYIDNQKNLSTFKIGQLLVQSQKLSKIGHYGLAFQAPYFLHRISDDIIKYPPDWDSHKVLTFGKRILSAEIESYSEERIDSLKLSCLFDMQDLNIKTKINDNELLDEINFIEEQLLSDNVEK